MGNGTAGGSRRSKKKKVRWVGRGGGEGVLTVLVILGSGRCGVC